MPKRGRPSQYRDEYAQQAGKLCLLLGATDQELAGFFDVSVTTIKNWKHEHPEFLAALNGGKAVADGNVAMSLYRRATGYDHRAVKISINPKTGKSHQVPYVERYPPDTTACIFWLKNRQPARWRDRANDAEPLDAPDVARRVREAVRAILSADGLSAVA